MKKNRIIKVIILILAIVSVLSLAGCGPKGKVRDVVDEFLVKANALDYQGMFDLMSNDSVKSIRGNKSLEEYMASKTDAEIAEAILRVILTTKIDDAEVFLKSIKFKYDNADIRGNFSAIFGEVTFTLNGETVKKNVIFNMNRKNVSEDWTLGSIAL